MTDLFRAITCLRLFLPRPNLCPPFPLSRRNPLAPGSRDSSLFANGSRFGPLQVHPSEGGQSSCYAVQFIFKSLAFFLELANYRLHH